VSTVVPEIAVSELPADLAPRPLVPTDALGVHAVLAAEESAALGGSDLAVAHVVAGWSRPDHDLATRSMGVFDGPLLVAFAEYVDAEHVDAGVLPEHRGRGIGTALARWLRERARAGGSTAVGMTVPQGGPSDLFLAGQGYRAAWTGWSLAPRAGTAVLPPLPAGHAVGAGPDAPQSRVVTDPAGAAVATARVVSAGRTTRLVHLHTRPDRLGVDLAAALVLDAVSLAAAAGSVRTVLDRDAYADPHPVLARAGLAVTATWVHRTADL
jgi:mycothiol synthase